MKITVDIETKTFVRLILVAGAFAAVVFLAWRLWQPLMIIVVSFFLALALNPPVSVLARRLPGQSRILASALAYVVVLAIVGVFVYLALPPIISETGRFVNQLPVYVEELSTQRGFVADLINRYGLQGQIDQLVDSLQNQFGGWAQGIGSTVVVGVTSIFSGFISLITVLVLTFLMLIEGPGWLGRMWNLYTSNERLERHKRLAVKMYKVVTSYVNGQVLVASIAAAAGLTTLLILTNLFNVSPEVVIPLTGIIFITDLIPLVGATIGAIIVGMVLLFNDPGAAVVFAIYFFIYQQIENNFIQPLVQSRSVELTALSVFLAIIIGISLLGLVGGIIAIPIAGCIRVLLLDYMQHRRHKAEAPKRGILAKIVSKASGN